MRNFFGRVYAMHPLAMMAGLCMIAITIPAVRWEWIRGSEPSVQATVKQVVHDDVMPPLNSVAGTINGVPALVTGLVDRKTTELKDALVQQGNRLQTNLETARDQITGPQGRIATLSASVTGTLGSFVSITQEKLNPTLDHIAGITGKVDAGLPPVIANVQAAAKELPDVMRDGRFLLARSARTMGHVEGAAQQIESAVPDALAKFKIAETALADSSQKTAGLMGNLETATKPLPKWARWTFGIAAQVSPTAVGVVSSLAAVGAFGH